MSTVLVVGGTGPSGFALVRRLSATGHHVTILHTGAHEVPFDAPVEHVHADPTERADLEATLRARTFDFAVSTSGRLRHVSAVLEHRVAKLVAITGLPAYPGWRIPPGSAGFPVPLRETDSPARTVDDANDDGLTARVRAGEKGVLAASARGAFQCVVLRYTMVYGPYSYIPFEWYFVRRVLDARHQLALEADGLMLPQRGYAENLAAAVLVALYSPDADGRIFNVGDEQVLSVRAIAETIADELGHRFQIESVPLRASPCGNPFTLRQNTIFDLGAIRSLGYRDEVGVVAATRRTARWLADHPVAPGSAEELSLGTGAFNYAVEDSVINTYQEVCRQAAAVAGKEAS